MKSKYFFLVFCILIFSSFAYAEELCEDNKSLCKVTEPVQLYQGFENITNHSEGEICIIYFYGDGCPHCAEVSPFLDQMQEKYKDQIEIIKYEVYHDLDGYQKYNEYCGIQNIPLNDI